MRLQRALAADRVGMVRMVSGMRRSQKVPQYRKSPLTQAVVNLYTRLPQNVTAETLHSIRGESEQQFPNEVELKQAHFELRLEQGSSPTASQQTAGWMFRSVDEKRIIQSRLDGFAFARLAPYEGWDSFTDEAKSFWSRYREIATPEAVTALGLKYTNIFNIPAPIKDFKDFFRTTPEVSPSMPQGLAGFFMQLQIPYPQENSMLVLTHTLVPPPQAGIVSLVLDIELTCANNVSSDESAIWQLLERHHNIKNDVFDACITDATKELIL